MTVEDQREQCRNAIEAIDARVGREHKALNQPGSTSVDSKPYRAALARVQRDETAGVAVAYDDRLARNWRKLGRFYDELEDAGAEVLIINMPGVDYRTAQGRMQTGMMAIMAEQKYMTAKDRGEKVADRTVARGVPNRVPFGYRRNGTFIDGRLADKVDPHLDAKALVPDPATAPLVRCVFEMRAEGWSWTEIGEWLTEQGAVPPRGGRWATSTLRNMVGARDASGKIASEVYLGVVMLGDRRVENAHEPLVSRRLWKQAQSATTVVRNGKNAAGVAGGILRCGNCDRPLSVTGGAHNPSYTCRRRLDGNPCPAPVYLSKRHADEFVDRVVRAALGDGEIAVVTAGRQLARLRTEWETAKAETEAYVMKVSALDRAFSAGYEAHTAKERAAEAAYRDEADRAEGAVTLPSASGYLSADLARRRHVARALIESVTVAPAVTRGPNADVEARFTIHWRGRG